MNVSSRKAEKSQKSFGQIFGWTTFAVALLALLIYGLSFFAAEPTIETITTQPAPSPTMTPFADMQNVKYKQRGARKH